MEKIAYLFPGQGQGSVKVGMGFDIWEHSKEARKIFFDAERHLQKSIESLCFFGPEEELLKTVNSQIACFVTNLAYVAARSQLGEYNHTIEFVFPKDPADFLAGHSVGYIAALVYAGAIDFYSGLDLVTIRSTLMERACRENPGKMVALINPDIKGIEILCEKYGVQIGNYNSATQVVLSGSDKLIDEIVDIIKKRSLSKKAIPLKTEGAFHSKLMTAIKGEFAGSVDSIDFLDPRIPIIGNTKAQIITTGKEAKKELIEQIDSPVLWHQSMEILKENDVTTFFEMGYGDVLTSNLKRGLVAGAAIAVVSVATLWYKWKKRKKGED